MNGSTSGQLTTDPNSNEFGDAHTQKALFVVGATIAWQRLLFFLAHASIVRARTKVVPSTLHKVVR